MLFTEKIISRNIIRNKLVVIQTIIKVKIKTKNSNIKNKKEVNLTTHFCLH